MYKKDNRVCRCCGKVYTYCPNCAEFANKPAYMAMFHDGNCKDIFMTCADFNHGDLTKNEAREILKNCDLSDKAHFEESVQKNLMIIFTDDKPVPEKAEKKEPTKIKPVVEKK